MWGVQPLLTLFSLDIYSFIWYNKKQINNLSNTIRKMRKRLFILIFTLCFSLIFPTTILASLGRFSVVNCSFSIFHSSFNYHQDTLTHEYKKSVVSGLKISHQRIFKNEAMLQHLSNFSTSNEKQFKISDSINFICHSREIGNPLCLDLLSTGFPLAWE